MTEAMEGAEFCFPLLLNSSCKKPEPPRSVTLLLYIVLSVISLLTVTLNLLVIISISHFRQLHTPTNLLLLSLAVSDFLVGSLLIPVEILMTATCWMLGDMMCALYYMLPVIIITSSVANMVLISVDRYMAICDPLHYPTKVTLKVGTVYVLLCWSYSSINSVFLLYDNLKQPGRYNSCNGECVVSISGTADLVVGFILPITVIVVLYTRVFMVAVSQARAMKSHVASGSVKHLKIVKVKRSEMKAAKTLSILIVVFLMCYSPYYCVSLSGQDILIGSSTEAFMIFLMYFNSCLNPIIYALFYPWFKKATRIIVTFKILQSNSSEANIL